MLTQQLRSNTAMDHQNTCCTDLLSSTTTARTTTATAKLPLKRKKGPTRIPRYKKAPGAPKRFKSAFIFFSTWKHKEIRKQLGKGNATESVSIILYYLVAAMMADPGGGEIHDVTKELHRCSFTSADPLS